MNANEARELLKIHAKEMSALAEIPIEDQAIASTLAIIKKAAMCGKNEITLDYDYTPGIDCFDGPIPNGIECETLAEALRLRGFNAEVDSGSCGYDSWLLINISW